MYYIEDDCYAKKNAVTVFLNLIAPYDAIWHRSFTYKLFLTSLKDTDNHKISP